jgi:hypothetical protein
MMLIWFLQPHLIPYLTENTPSDVVCTQCLTSIYGARNSQHSMYTVLGLIFLKIEDT